MNGLILKPGDPCPCCGELIKTSGPDMLLALSWIAWQKSRPVSGAAGHPGQFDQEWRGT